MAENIDITIDVNAKTPKQTVGELRKEFRELQKSIGDTVQGTDEYYSKLKRLAEIKDDLQGIKNDIKDTNKELSKPIEGSVTQLRQEYKDLQKSIGNTAQGTDEYYAKLKRLATIKGDLQDLKDDIRGLDPGASFQALQGVAQGLVGGFTALTGAVALFNGENEELEKTLVKVNSAIALLGGFQAFNDGLRQAQVLLNLTGGQFKILLGAITVVAGAITYFALQTSEAQKQVKLLADIQTKAIEGYIKEKVAVEQLLSEAQNENTTRKRKKEIIQELNDLSPLYFNSIKTEKDLQDKATDAVAKYVKAIELKAQAQAASDLLVKAEEPIIKRQIKLERQLEAARTQTFDTEERKQRQIEGLTKIIKEGTDTQIIALRKKAEPIKKVIADIDKQLEKLGGDPTGTRNKNFQKGLEDAKKNAEARLKIEEDFEKQRQAIDDKIKFQQTQKVDPNELANEAKARADALAKATGAETFNISKIRNPLTGLTLDESLAKIQSDFEQQQLLLLQQRASGEISEQEYNAKIAKLEEDNLNKRINTKKLFGEKTTQEELLQAQSRIKIAKLEEEQKIAGIQAIANATSALSNLIGKETAAGKALAIATALINTYLGVTEALKQKSTLPSPFDVITKIANVAAILATGISAVKQIASVKVPGGGGAGGSTPSAGGGIPTTAPTLQPQTAVQTVNTILNPTQAQQLNPANIPAPVVSVTEINRVQNQVRVIEGNNTVGIRRPI